MGSEMCIRDRIVTRDWDLYDTRHVVYRPARLTPSALKQGYDRAYRDFYRWSSILRGSFAHGSVKHQAKHFFYAAGWKKFERLWDFVIRAQELRAMTPFLEAVLSKVTGSQGGRVAERQPAKEAPAVSRALASAVESFLPDGSRSAGT